MEELEILKRHSNYFNYDKKYFELLKSMSFDKLNIPNNNSIILTPLLEEICRYAMVLPAFNELELDMIKESFDNPEAFEELLEVIDCSFNYVSDAIDYGCCHPTILTFNSLLNGSDIYDEMIESIYENCYMFDANNLESIFEVDQYVTTSEDEIFDCFAQDNNIFKSVHELGDVLKKVSVDRARNKMLMDKYDTYSTNIGGSDIQVKVSSGITKDSYSVLSSETFRKTNHNFDTSKIENFYNLYKLYQYNYLKNSNEHSKLMKKCKSL